MSDHPPVEGRPGRRRGFPIGSRIASIAIIAALIAWGIGRFLAPRGDLVNQNRITSWVAQVQKDDPSLKMLGMTSKSQSNPIGTAISYQYRFESPTGRPITIEGDLHTGAFRGPSRVIIAAEGRSVTWPIEDVDRGRKLDLRAEFPEAFR